MKFTDVARMCFDNLKRRKGRTILTVLGVFIGCTSIVVMVSIGIGMTESTNQMLEEMGDLSIIEVSRGWNETGEETAALDDTAVESFRALEGVAAVMPKASLNQYSIQMYAGINDRYQCGWGEIVGMDTDAMEAMGYELLDGKVPGSGKNEALAGQWLAYNFYDTLMPEGRNYADRWAYDENGNQIDPPDPFFNVITTPIVLEIDKGDGTEVKIRQELKITGVTKEDYGKGWETSEGIMMPIAAMKDLMTKIDGSPVNAKKLTYSTVLVKCEDISLVTEIEESIKSMGFYTYSMESMRESMEESSRQVQLMLGGLGAISLFVAAIGITNTMIMSISERTREIGIMKALGCYVRDIRLLFLMEAGAIGMMGGIIGCIVSLVISVGINLVSMGVLGGGSITGEMVLQALIGGEGVTRISVVPLSLMGFAVIFSIFVGLVSGYYPANKAVKIPALEAIKHE
ncbi:MAG: ABC transporter permease [Firmicutes bacterium]|nr:ABC transporter permease [Bacillota bacterium]